MPVSFIRSNWLVIALGLVMSPIFVAVTPVVIEFGNSMQDRLSPVVEEWIVLEHEIVGEDLFISGTLIKRRPCIFSPPTLARDEGGRNHTVISYSPTAGKTWAPDDAPQQWGPWKVPGGAGKRLTFLNVYLCNSGRPTVTELGTFSP